MRCSKCGWDLDRLARACPVCGTPTPSRVEALSRIAAYVSIIGVVLMVLKQIIIG